MNRQDDFSETEDFTELFRDDDNIETLENTIEILEETREVRYQDNYDNDFADLVKKRDYKGKNELEIRKEKRHGKKRKLKKWVYVILLIILLGGGFATYEIIHNINLKKAEEKRIADEKMLASIKEHYNTFVKTIRDTSLYKKDGSEYVKIGDVYKDVNLNLVDQEITLDTKYFQIKNLDYYIFYGDLEKTEEIKNDNRYKKYIPFNSNIVTKDEFSLYDNDNKLYTFNKSMEFPIIINNYGGKYYVEYNDMLVSIKKDEVLKTVDKKNTDKKNQSKITTLAYHRVYDTTDTCTDSYVCLKKATFDKQMKYLSDNNYLTLTLNEMEMYMKGNLQIEKGVVITFDDGYLFKASDEVLDKYNLNGTMFVISGDFVDKYDQFKGLKAIDIQSHTHKMHKNYVCAGGNQGGAILCATKQKIVDDLKTSLKALGVDPIGLAFPFYDYNENAISALKEVGFKMSFVGRAGTLGKATPKVTDLYKIPRMTVWEESLMSFNTWKSFL